MGDRQFENAGKSGEFIEKGTVNIRGKQLGYKINAFDSTKGSGRAVFHNQTYQLTIYPDPEDRRKRIGWKHVKKLSQLSNNEWRNATETGKLKEHDLVVEKQDPNDGRRYVYKLTDKGRKMEILSQLVKDRYPEFGEVNTEITIDPEAEYGVQYQELIDKDIHRTTDMGLW